MRETIKKLVEKHWDSNWHDSRTIEGDTDWIMLFVYDIINAWLRKFNEEAEKEDRLIESEKGWLPKDREEWEKEGKDE